MSTQFIKPKEPRMPGDTSISAGTSWEQFSVEPTTNVSPQASHIGADSYDKYDTRMATDNEILAEFQMYGAQILKVIWQGGDRYIITRTDRRSQVVSSSDIREALRLLRTGNVRY